MTDKNYKREEGFGNVPSNYTGLPCSITSDNGTDCIGIFRKSI